MRHLAWIEYVRVLAEAETCDCGGIHLAIVCNCGCRRLRELVIPTADIERHDRDARRMLVWGNEVSDGPNRAARRKQATH